MNLSLERKIQKITFNGCTWSNIFWVEGGINETKQKTFYFSQKYLQKTKFNQGKEREREKET